MLEQDLSRRVARLMRGERRQDDLDRLFLAMRERPGARQSVREIGDFVAHRDQREKGIVTQKARDIFTSLQSWLRISVMHQPFTLADIRRVAEANLRIATDEQLKERLGLRRRVVKSVLPQALNKLERGQNATPRERKAINYLGGAFIWNPAFTDAEVIQDLLHMLGEAGILQRSDYPTFCALSAFITLHVVTLMHGSAVLLANGDRATLVAGFDNKECCLEVKAFLTVKDMPKPVFAPTCLFWTTLSGAAYCSQELLDDPSRWEAPLDIDPDGKLASLN